MMRLINILVIGALIVAASYVYKIKFDSTLQAERVAKLRTDLHRVRDGTAALRAQWGQLDSPARIQGLVERHLQLKPVDAQQFDSLDRLPDRPATGESPDAIGAMISLGAPDLPTGSIKTPAAR